MTLDARRRLVALTPPTRLPLSAFRTGPSLPARALLRFYREGERRFVDWEVLAAVNFVETGFNKLRAGSAGAQGPMQFMPATWRAYGLGGSVHDPRDAILGAANYLRVRSGARPAPRSGTTTTRSAMWTPSRRSPRRCARPGGVPAVPRLAGLREDSVRAAPDHGSLEEAGGVGAGGAPTCARPSFVSTLPRGVR